MTDAPLYPSTDAQEICPGLVREWYLDKKIVAYQLSNMSQKILEVWSQTAAETIQNWSKDRPYAALHNLSEHGVAMSYMVMTRYDMFNPALTPAGRQLVEPLFSSEFPGYIAVVFAMSVSGNVGMALTNRKPGGNPHIQYKTFFNQQKALEWLAAQVVEPK